MGNEVSQEDGQPGYVPGQAPPGHHPGAGFVRPTATTASGFGPSSTSGFGFGNVTASMQNAAASGPMSFFGSGGGSAPSGHPVGQASTTMPAHPQSAPVSRRSSATSVRPVAQQPASMGASPVSSHSPQPPMPTPDVDLSQLSEEERAIIASVMARAENMNQDPEPTPLPREPEIKRGSPQVGRQEPPGIRRACPLCHVEDLPPNANECADCRQRVCYQCGAMMPSPTTKRPEWVCSNCVKRRQQQMLREQQQARQGQPMSAGGSPQQVRQQQQQNGSGTMGGRGMGPGQGQPTPQVRNQLQQQQLQGAGRGSAQDQDWGRNQGFPQSSPSQARRDDGKSSEYQSGKTTSLSSTTSSVGGSTMHVASNQGGGASRPSAIQTIGGRPLDDANNYRGRRRLQDLEDDYDDGLEETDEEEAEVVALVAAGNRRMMAEESRGGGATATASRGDAESQPEVNKGQHPSTIISSNGHHHQQPSQQRHYDQSGDREQPDDVSSSGDDYPPEVRKPETRNEEAEQDEEDEESQEEEEESGSSSEDEDSAQPQILQPLPYYDHSSGEVYTIPEEEEEEVQSPAGHGSRWSGGVNPTYSDPNVIKSKKIGDSSSNVPNQSQQQKHLAQQQNQQQAHSGDRNGQGTTNGSGGDQTRPFGVVRQQKSLEEVLGSNARVGSQVVTSGSNIQQQHMQQNQQQYQQLQQQQQQHPQQPMMATGNMEMGQNPHLSALQQQSKGVVGMQPAAMTGLSASSMSNKNVSPSLEAAEQEIMSKFQEENQQEQMRMMMSHGGLAGSSGGTLQFVGGPGGPGSLSYGTGPNSSLHQQQAASAAAQRSTTGTISGMLADFSKALGLSGSSPRPSPQDEKAPGQQMHSTDAAGPAQQMMHQQQYQMPNPNYVQQQNQPQLPTQHQQLPVQHQQQLQAQQQNRALLPAQQQQLQTQQQLTAQQQQQQQNHQQPQHINHMQQQAQYQQQQQPLNQQQQQNQQQQLSMQQGQFQPNQFYQQQQQQLQNPNQMIVGSDQMSQQHSVGQQDLQNQLHFQQQQLQQQQQQMLPMQQLQQIQQMQQQNLTPQQMQQLELQKQALHRRLPHPSDTSVPAGDPYHQQQLVNFAGRQYQQQGLQNMGKQGQVIGSPKTRPRTTGPGMMMESGGSTTNYMMGGPPSGSGGVTHWQGGSSQTGRPEVTGTVLMSNGAISKPSPAPRGLPLTTTVDGTPTSVTAFSHAHVAAAAAAKLTDQQQTGDGNQQMLYNQVLESPGMPSNRLHAQASDNKMQGAGGFADDHIRRAVSAMEMRAPSPPRPSSPSVLMTSGTPGSGPQTPGTPSQRGGDSDTQSEADSVKSGKVRRKLPPLPADQDPSPLPSRKTKDRTARNATAHERARLNFHVRQSSLDSATGLGSKSGGNTSIYQDALRPTSSASESNLISLASGGGGNTGGRGSQFRALKSVSVSNLLGSSSSLHNLPSKQYFSSSVASGLHGHSIAKSGQSATAEFDRYSMQLPVYLRSLKQQLRDELKNVTEERRRAQEQKDSSFRQDFINAGLLPKDLLQMIPTPTRKPGAPLSGQALLATRNKLASARLIAQPVRNKGRHRRQLSDSKIPAFSPIKEDKDFETEMTLRTPYKSFEYESIDDALRAEGLLGGSFSYGTSGMAPRPSTALGTFYDYPSSSAAERDPGYNRGSSLELRDTVIGSGGSGVSFLRRTAGSSSDWYLSRRSSEGRLDDMDQLLGRSCSQEGLYWSDGRHGRHYYIPNHSEPSGGSYNAYNESGMYGGTGSGERRSRKPRSWHPSPYVSEDEDDQLTREEKKQKIKAEIARRRRQIEENTRLHHELLRLAHAREQASAKLQATAAAASVGIGSHGSSASLQQQQHHQLQQQQHQLQQQLQQQLHLLNNQRQLQHSGGHMSAGYGSCYDIGKVDLRGMSGQQQQQQQQQHLQTMQQHHQQQQMLSHGSGRPLDQSRSMPSISSQAEFREAGSVLKSIDEILQYDNYGKPAYEVYGDIFGGRNQRGALNDMSGAGRVRYSAGENTYEGSSVGPYGRTSVGSRSRPPLRYSLSAEDESIDRIASTFAGGYEYARQPSYRYDGYGDCCSPLTTDIDTPTDFTPAMPLLPDMPSRSRKLLEHLGGSSYMDPMSTPVSGRQKSF